MADTLKDSPAFECAAYQRQAKSLELVSDTYTGTEALIAKDQKYLPQEERESDKAYRIRLKRATFYNAYARTVAGLVGMVFRKNPRLGEDVPDAIKTLAENIDLQGNHLDVFAKELFTDAHKGHSFILVDMPPKLAAGSTLADERAAGRRPYWTMYGKEQVINWRTETKGGAPRLVQVTLRERPVEPDGRFGEREFKRYRVLRPGSYEIWEQREDQKEPVLISDGQTNLMEIPLVPIYTGKTGFFESRPPLLDLAFQNLRHYRLVSDLDRILHKASVPILYFVNRDTTKNVETISPDTGFDVGEGGAVGWAEIQGGSISSAQTEITNVEGRMAALGLSVIAEQPRSARTATESVMDYEAESSELSTWARSLEDGLEMAVDYTAQFLGMKAGDGGSVEVNKDFTRMLLTSADIAMYSEMVAAGQLDIETLWALMQRAEKLPDDFNPDEAKERIVNPNNAA